MARYNKTFTVRANRETAELQVFYEGKLLYTLSARVWPLKLHEWRSTGWEIIWS